MAEVVDTDTSVKTDTSTFKARDVLNIPILHTLKWFKNKYYSSVFAVTCTGESSVLFAGAVSVVIQGERTVPQVNLIPSALDSVHPHNTFTSTKD